MQRPLKDIVLSDILRLLLCLIRLRMRNDKHTHHHRARHSFEMYSHSSQTSLDWQLEAAVSFPDDVFAVVCFSLVTKQCFCIHLWFLFSNICLAIVLRSR